MELVTGLTSFLVYGSIVLKFKLTGITDTDIIWLATIAFFFQNGIGQYSSLLASIISTIYIFTQYILLDNLVTVILFVVAVLSYVIAIVSLWRTKLEDAKSSWVRECLDANRIGNNYDITSIAILVFFSVLIGFLIKNNFPEMTENRIYLFGGFIIISCYGFIKSKALLYAILPVVIVSYAIYNLFTFDTSLIILVSCLALFSIFSLGYTYSLKSQIVGAETELRRLADENKKLRNTLMELREADARNENRNGIWDGLGRVQTVEWVVDKLKWLIKITVSVISG